MEEPQQEQAKEEVKEVENQRKINIPNIFKAHHIDKIYNSQDPIKDCNLYFESNYRATTGKPDFESSQLYAKAEFAVNVLIFLKETFPNFEPETLSKLLNLYCNLIEMSEQVYKDESNFLNISKLKLEEFKLGLYQLNLIPKMKSEVALANDKDKKITPEGKFFLNKQEIVKLLEYIHTEFLPYIQIWYYISNETRQTENKKISIIINKPIESIPLSFAEMQKEEEKKEEVKIENEDDYKTFLGTNCDTISLNISQNSQIYQKNLNEISEEVSQDKKKLEELLNYDLLLRESGSPSRRILDYQLAIKGKKIEHPRMESISNKVILSIAVNGNGIALLPYEVVQKELEAGTVKEIELDVPLERKLFIINHINKKFTSTEKKTFLLCQKLLANRLN